jgi:CxxC motif-containing protein (DUF1111 family)
MSGRIGRSGDRPVRARWLSAVAGILGASALLGPIGAWAADAGKAPGDDRARGRELFEREWLPGDTRTRGGDGLGPVFNDSSCIACHNLGGAGGGGPASKNVDIITASSNNQMPQFAGGEPPAERGFLGRALGSLVGRDDADDFRPRPATTRPAARRRPDTRELIKAHPGFRTARSVVLHRFGTGSEYESWRQSMLGFGGAMPPGTTADPSMSMMMVQNAVNMSRFPTQNNVGAFVLVRSQRNPTPLYGAGLIDAIPDRVLEEAAQLRHPGFPEVAGRVSRLKDKRIGRFGWKGQTATLEDFVLTACAVELGLEVPGHHQGGVPQKPGAKAKGLDLGADECNALVSYIRGLPRPAERRPPAEADAREIDAGRKLFASVGCASCHTPRLGAVDGIYSDLLLHDLGQQLGDTGQYSVFDPSSSEEEFVDEETGPVADAAGAATALPLPPSGRDPFLPDASPVQGTPPPPGAIPAPPSFEVGSAAVVAETFSVTPPAPLGFTGAAASIKRPTTGPASRFEWRTPPLWGFRDSGPYLHDGRADTLDQAVALHGGEAANIARKFFGLGARERRQVESFLKSLTSPSPEATERVASAR